MNLFCIVSKARVVPAVALLLLVVGVRSPAMAQTANGYTDEDEKRIKSAQVVGALGDDLFGEQVNLYTGATSFQHSDLSLPGNNALTMAVSRRLEIRSSEVAYGRYNHGFGDWQLEVPYLGGTFIEALGWTVDTASPQARCSSPQDPLQAAPPVRYAASALFTPYEYWHGYDLVVPGQGSQPLLLKTSNSLPTPSTGGPYKWITKDLWQVSCLPGLAAPSLVPGYLPSGYGGEGFVARAPDGSKYTFDHMVLLPAKPVSYRGIPLSAGTKDYIRELLSGVWSHLFVTTTWVFSVDYMGVTTSVQTDLGGGSLYSEISGPAGLNNTPLIFEPRKEIRLYVTKVEDRFGNVVNYNWSGANLTSISASDGRSLTFTYSGNRIIAVSDGLRTVNYAYDANGSLSTVTYPDSSQWTLNLANVYPQHYDGTRVGIGIWDMASPECGYKYHLANQAATGTLVHPSGATGNFSFQFKRHVRASVPDSHCNYDTLTAPGTVIPFQTTDPDHPWKIVSWTPRTFDILAITSKQISGPGVATAQWTYAYAGDGAILEDDYGPQTRSVTVTEPGNTHRVFTFGNRFGINEGQLLALDTFAGTTLVKHDGNFYVSDADIASQPGLFPFTSQIGLNPYWASDTFWSERHHPLKLEEILQDDVAYTRTINAFDALARPINVTRASSLLFAGAPTSRTDVTTYEDNTASWTLGQVKTVVNTDTIPNKVIINNTYHAATSLLTTSQVFGFDQPTLAYNADGTVASVTDRRSKTTTLANWYRGVPGTITYHDLSSESALVNNRGWVESVTDKLGTTTGYSYDNVGRLALINYTNSDSVQWTDTTRGFVPVTVAEYGLPGSVSPSTAPGHWKQTAQTGNGRSTTYYDSLWRPRLILAEDTGNASSQSFVVKRYDSAGREAFTSYPVGPPFSSVDDTTLKGIRTFYDGLGRVIRVEQDAEAPLGVLVTTTEYLPGFQIRVTNPRGYQTTSSYQVFDAPSTDSPVTISAPGDVRTIISRDIFGKPLSVTRSGPGS